MILQGGVFSEKEEQLRATLAKLDRVDADADATGGALTSEDLTLLRRQLGEQQTLVRETLDRLAQVQEENEHIARRRDELEQRLQTLEAEYEELLGACRHTPPSFRSHAIAEKTIHDEENNNLDIADSMAELKVKKLLPHIRLQRPLTHALSKGQTRGSISSQAACSSERSSRPQTAARS